MKYKKYSITAIVAISCIIMGWVDAVIQPGYAIKSAIKAALFLILPLSYAYFHRDCDLKSLLIPKKKGIKIALLAGIFVYVAIVGGYFIFRNIFDFSLITGKLGEGAGVNKGNFAFVALYISFANSLLEEFFFRGFSFFSLKKVS
ncbi:MAG: CPBP family intramembrane glutamate endopeptidase, partial [Oscillospiraceae bacterium]